MSVGLFAAACAADQQVSDNAVAPGEGLTAFVGGRIIDGTGADPIDDGVLLVRDGRIGKIKRIQAAIGCCGGGGPFKPQEVPGHFDYETWLGQAPDAPYFPQRCHFSFRWFYAYSGGQMTDWGAHHVDIAHWGLWR